MEGRASTGVRRERGPFRALVFRCSQPRACRGDRGASGLFQFRFPPPGLPLVGERDHGVTAELKPREIFSLRCVRWMRRSCLGEWPAHTKGGCRAAGALRAVDFWQFRHSLPGYRHGVGTLRFDLEHLWCSGTPIRRCIIMALRAIMQAQ